MGKSKMQQIYSHEDIKQNKDHIYGQYIQVLIDYQDALINVKLFDSVRDYIVNVEVKTGDKHAIINGNLLLLKKRFNETYLEFQGKI